MVVSLVSKSLTKVFGSRNDRLIKTYHRRVEQINELEDQTRLLTDDQLRAKTTEFRELIAQGQAMSSIMPQVLAVAREVMDRAVGIRNIFNPQHQFDPEQLPVDLRPLYGAVAQTIAQTPDIEEPGCNQLVPRWQQVPIPNELYEAVRQIYPQSRPPFRARPFDVQLIGGMVLGQGRIAEMKTGEGKTIVAPLACYVACIENLRCHVVTVNDYLVQRDRDWVFPFYYHLGLTVGAIHPFHMQSADKKQEAYGCDVLYGTNSELGFDYLRDNMKLLANEQVQTSRDFCIIDEVDSILIDEARTPLIISGPAHDDAPRYGLADDVARHLMQKQRDWNAADTKAQQALMRIKGLEGDIRNSRDKAKIPAMRQEMDDLLGQIPTLEAKRDQHAQYYEVERDKKAAHLTHEGVAQAQTHAGVGSFYVGNNMDMPHLLENALRAHVIYQRDKEYVVQAGEVVIVDEFTGRLMVGRQWSDGLHQAIETKEKVKIKQETQTLATVTIQNFFKLYKRLAGMTGTAITEGTEFNEIYSLDVICIPTNVPVIRHDRNDLIFLSAKDKWEAILDDIKRMNDIGRPVLVGTTSVEKSEMLSQRLTKKYAVPHEVLNAKEHERESHVVEHAGELGAVMIATNMAGRGTDIRLAPIDKATLIHHWQKRDLLPKQANPQMPDDELISLCYRHIAHRLWGDPGKDSGKDQSQTDGQIRSSLLRYWVQDQAYIDQAKAAKMTDQACLELLDKAPEFMLHRLVIYTSIEQMGGLHIVGTERHEARRIDNQLRGRAGRQGDRGSSRFFISLEDDLMKMFAGKTTMTALSKLGMKQGDAIEHKWITKSVERAQRKVEERNYEIRKNLLEYDEVMEYQRHTFYSIRQDVLEGHHIQDRVFEQIADAVDDAVRTYLDPDYVPTQIAQWCHQTLDISIEPGKLRADDLASLQHQISKQADTEIEQTIAVTLGEYMSDEVPPDEWDARGLCHWAMSQFQVDLKHNQVKKMNPGEVQTRLIESAKQQFQRKDLSGLGKFLAQHYAQQNLAAWANNKFGVELDVHELAKLDTDDAAQLILDKARQAYRQREVTYPVQFVLEMAFQAAQQDRQWAVEQLIAWANQRYQVGWTLEQIGLFTDKQLQEELLAQSQAWVAGDKLQLAVDQAMAEHTEIDALAQWGQQRFGQAIDPKELQPLDTDQRRDLLLDNGRKLLRLELAQLERFVLLQILDSCWKDHLYAMDQLRDSVGLRGYAEKDPRIEYKREGAEHFAQMQQTVRDRVTDLIFRAKLTANVQARNVYQDAQARHAQPDSSSALSGTAQQQADLDAAQQAGAQDTDRNKTRKQRRAAAAATTATADNKPQHQRFKHRKKKRR